MSDKLTRLKLPGARAFTGIMDWGERDAADMIRQARDHADHLAAQANEVRQAADTEFQIDVVRGSHVQHHIRAVQEAVKQSLTTEDRNYPELPVSSFLREAAEHFEKQPTNGEDRAHWANVHNAQNCRIAAAAIEVMHVTLGGWLAFFHGDASLDQDEALAAQVALTREVVRSVPNWKQLQHEANKHGKPRTTDHQLEQCPACDGSGEGVADTICTRCGGLGGISATPIN